MITTSAAWHLDCKYAAMVAIHSGPRVAPPNRSSTLLKISRLPDMTSCLSSFVHIWKVSTVTSAYLLLFRRILGQSHERVRAFGSSDLYSPSMG